MAAEEFQGLDDDRTITDPISKQIQLADKCRAIRLPLIVPTIFRPSPANGGQGVYRKLDSSAALCVSSFWGNSSGLG